jgi:hypothetical protein
MIRLSLPFIGILPMTSPFSFCENFAC